MVEREGRPEGPKEHDQLFLPCLPGGSGGQAGVRGRRARAGLALVLLVLLPSGCATAGAGGIPEAKRWESHMLQYAKKWCEHLKDPRTSGEHKLAATYYDGMRVYQQIADYTKDPRWLDCARHARDAYRDGYVLRHEGKVPGYWIFPHGLLEDFKRTGDVKSKEALLLLARNAAFANVGKYDPDEYILTSQGSRETAYNLEAKLLAEEVGGHYRADIQFFKEAALRHIDQWCVSGDAAYIQPFMVGLTLEALILYAERTGEPLMPHVRTAADCLWERLWVARAEAFLYIDRAVEAAGGQPAMQPAPDLNLLIAPAFAWLYLKTGEAKYRERGDRIFVGGVAHAGVDSGAKQFNQSYRWSFDYLRWRRLGDAAAPATSRQPSVPARGNAPLPMSAPHVPTRP